MRERNKDRQTDIERKRSILILNINVPTYVFIISFLSLINVQLCCVFIATCKYIILYFCVNIQSY